LTAGSLWIPILGAAAAAAAALVVLFRNARRLPQAIPGPRSLHGRPVPRVGGLSIWAGFAPAAFLDWPALPGPPAAWLLAFASVAAISLVDDIRGVHPGVRMVAHVGAALAVAAVIVTAGAGDSGFATIVGVGAVALAIAWSANLYNFMDGSDGMAALMAAVGFAAYGFAAERAGGDGGAYFALAAAALPFLVVNLPPARMFMGDVGAVPLGFLAAAFGFGGWRAGMWPDWFPLLVFLPFVADATVTLAARTLRRERLWEAHKFHYYQRLHQLGAGHSGTLGVFGVLIAGTAASAATTLALDPGSGWLVTVAWGGVLLALFSGIEYYWQRRIPKPP
jgi:UDP-GlcNAc:undecaprenyl-phosphate/decaprenyl-phosphate GlcNAc-1-phosphate transferase